MLNILKESALLAENSVMEIKKSGKHNTFLSDTVRLRDSNKHNMDPVHTR